MKQAIPCHTGSPATGGAKHDERFHHRVEVFYLFNEVATEMNAHMQKGRNDPVPADQGNLKHS